MRGHSDAIPAVSTAVIKEGKIVQLRTAGVRNATSGTPADPDTIFGGAEGGSTPRRAA